MCLLVTNILNSNLQLVCNVPYKAKLFAKTKQKDFLQNYSLPNLVNIEVQIAQEFRPLLLSCQETENIQIKKINK